MIKSDFVGFLKKLLWGVTFDSHRFSIGLFFSIVFYKIPGIIHINSGLIVIPLFLYLILKEKNTYRKILYFNFVLLAFLINIPRASANHNAARYTIMVTPLFFYFISPFIISIIEKVRDKLQLNKAMVIVPFLLIILGFGIYYKNSLSSFSIFPRFTKNYRQTLDWLKNHTNKNDSVIIESNSKLQYKWYIPNINQVNISSTKNGKELTPEEYRKLFKRFNARYIVVDTGAKSAYNKKPKYFFYSSLKDNSPENLMNNLGLNFKLVFKSSSNENDNSILIYKRDKEYK
ncbi:MAG: hypothetical protein F6K39_46655 [Okeania sp. SIO3B3]|nr:hypothetical protein [Okeania sp. SIO3B3]